MQEIHSQDIATESKIDSKDVENDNDDDIDFTKTNTGIIRRNIFGDNESKELNVTDRETSTADISHLERYRSDVLLARLNKVRC